MLIGCVFLGVSLLALPRITNIVFSEQPSDAQHHVADDGHARDRCGDPLPAFAVARLGTVRFKQGGTVNSIAFSPDGKTVASVSGEHLMPWPEIRMWNTKDGRLVSRLDFVYGISAKDKAGSCCRPSEGSAPVFAPDGSALALPCETKVLVWNFKGKGSYRLLGTASRYVGACAYSQDGKLLAWGSVVPGNSGPVATRIVYDATTGEPVRTIDTPAKVKKMYGSLRDSTVLAVLDDGTAGVWDISTGARRWPIKRHIDIEPVSESDKVRVAAFSPDGRTFATANRDQIVTWNVSTDEKIRSISVPSYSVVNMAFVPPGHLLATLDQDSISVWDTAKTTRVDRIAVAGWCRHIAFRFR